MSTTALLDGCSWVSDGGLETDLIFHRGFDLPEFASFPLVEDRDGTAALERYYRGYAAIAAAADAGLLLESPTWRANPDWGQRLGYDATALARVNTAAIALMRRLADTTDADRVLVSGVVGPRGDGYLAGGADPDEAAAYHARQVQVLAEAGADLVHAMTLTGPAEAIGVIRSARDTGLPVAVSFTVETDGRLPDGTTLAQAVASVDSDGAPDWYGVNCAHPTHLLAGLDGGGWQDRIAFFRPNASTLSHAELDEADVLDAGDLDLLTSSTASLRGGLPAVRVLGGCCGTDSSHVAALWGV